MATSRFFQFMFSNVPMLTFVPGNCVIDSGESSYTRSVKGGMIAGVSRVSQGVYDILLTEPFARYLSGTWGFIAAPAATSGIMCVEVEGNPNTSIADAAAPKVRVHMLDKAGALADPADNTVFGFTMMARNSSLKGKGE